MEEELFVLVLKLVATGESTKPAFRLIAAMIGEQHSRDIIQQRLKVIFRIEIIENNLRCRKLKIQIINYIFPDRLTDV